MSTSVSRSGADRSKDRISVGQLESNRENELLICIISVIIICCFLIIIYMKYHHEKSNVPFRGTRPHLALLSDNSFVGTPERPDILYKGPSTQCSENYFPGPPRLSDVNFCKAFVLDQTSPSHYAVYFGKYFLESEECLSISFKELSFDLSRMPWYKRFLNLFGSWYSYQKLMDLDTERFGFIHSGIYTPETCRALPFIQIKPMKLPTKDHRILQRFLLARAFYTRDSCEWQREVIPALYSLDTKQCYFGVSLNKVLRASDSCQIICDSLNLNGELDEAAQEKDLWYITNKLKNSTNI